jgi:hypothetical protein
LDRKEIFGWAAGSAGHKGRVNCPHKKKWFQVIRFPALLTAGMHRFEHRNRGRRTLCLSAPRLPFSPAAGYNASKHAAKLYLDRGRSLASAFRSPATAPDSLRLHSRVNVPGLPLRYLTESIRCPFGLSLHN